MPKTSIQKERGERLALARQRAGNPPHREVAKHLGVSRQLIGTWEAGGNITADQLALLCVLYGCCPQYVLFGTPEEASESEAEQFAAVPQPLRGRLWMLYQVFLRRGAATELDRAPSSQF